MVSQQWEEYLNSYYEQKRLEEYQKNRILNRPKTTKLTVVIYFTILLIIVSSFIVVLFSISSLEMWINILISAVFIICVMESYGRLVAIKFVECYQHYASDEKRRSCKCVPSCSEYAILCFKKYELFYSLLKIRKRLFVTCKGFDYIIDNP